MNDFFFNLKKKQNLCCHVIIDILLHIRSYTFEYFFETLYRLSKWNLARY